MKKRITGESFSLIARCECGMEHGLDNNDSFDAEDFVEAVCDSCGDEFCSDCKKEVKECHDSKCKTSVCLNCWQKVDDKIYCEDCAFCG